MARLEWDTGPRPYHAGVERGVLYLPGNYGVSWNGLVSVNEQVSGGAASPVYFEGQLAGIVRDSEDFVINVSAYTYPDEFDRFAGNVGIDNQNKPYFGLSYQTGTDLTGQIHLVYDVRILPPTKDWKTTSRSAVIELFQWRMTSKPFDYTRIKPTSHIVVDLKTADPGAITALKNKLYGTSSTVPELPTLAELLLIFEVAAPFSVIDNGDGTWTATGSDTDIQILANGRSRLSGPTVVQVDSTTYRISTSF